MLIVFVYVLPYLEVYEILHGVGDEIPHINLFKLLKY